MGDDVIEGLMDHEQQTPPGRLLREVADAAPDAALIVCEDRTVSRRDVEERSNRLARAYAALGVDEGDTVAIMLPNGIEFFEALFAVYKLGAVPLPLSWRVPLAERQAIVELGDPKLIVGVPDPSEHPERACLAPGFAPDPGLDAGPILPDRVSPSASLTTSGGSTGRPKLMRAAVSAGFDSRPMASMFGMTPDGSMLLATPLYHGGGFTFSLAALALGCKVVVLPKFDAVKALDAITEHKVQFLSLVPTMMLRMLRAIEAHPDRFDLSSVQMLLHGAGPCAVWVKRAWIELLGPEKILEIYGASESPVGTMITGLEWLEHPGSVGLALPGSFKIVDEDGKELPHGEVGEIFVQPPEALPVKAHLIGAEPRIVDGWVSVGDLGSIDEDGYLYISDRRVDMIVAGGANVFPAEVEAALLEHPDVVGAIVVGLPDEDLGSRVHAIVEAQDGTTEAELLAFLGERLTRYKVPRSIRFTSEPLHDDAGKARRSALRDAEIELLGLSPTR